MFECEHCHTTYTSERFYINHGPKCKTLLKKIEIKSIIGKNAFSYYKSYLKTKHCYNTDIETFSNSKYYKSFINFANFVISKKIPDIKTYLEFVNDRRIMPPVWCSDLVYSEYIKYLDTLEPLTLVHISIASLNKLSKIFNCEITEVLLKLYINEIIQLLHSRHLSPWFLLNSIHIESVLTNPSITESQHKVLEMFINPETWSNKFKQKGHHLIKIKKTLHDLKL